jgi:hypothetical protein
METESLATACHRKNRPATGRSLIYCAIIGLRKRLTRLRRQCSLRTTA